MELVLSTFGTTLGVDNGNFVVRQSGTQQSIPAADVSSIQISRGSGITSDAVILAVGNEIPVVFVDKRGMPIGRIWSSKYGSISTIRKGQLNFSSGHKAVLWICDVICRKIQNQQALIIAFNARSGGTTTDAIDTVLRRLERYAQKVSNLTSSESVRDIASVLRGYEGNASKIYFEALNQFLPTGLRINGRSQNPASDPLNAMLNYGYGILYGRIEGALIKSGIDPYIGILHRDEYNRPVLVYDIIELFRIWIDYVVYHLAQSQVLTDDCFSRRSDGSCWLEGLGRRILIQSVNDYMEEHFMTAPVVATTLIFYGLLFI